MGNGWSRRTCAGRPAREASTRASDSAQIEAFRFKPACGMEVGEARGMSGRTFTAELCASIPWSPARSGEGDGEHGSREGADWRGGASSMWLRKLYVKWPGLENSLSSVCVEGGTVFYQKAKAKAAQR